MANAIAVPPYLSASDVAALYTLDSRPPQLGVPGALPNDTTSRLLRLPQDSPGAQLAPPLLVLPAAWAGPAPGPYCSLKYPGPLPSTQPTRTQRGRARR